MRRWMTCLAALGFFAAPAPADDAMVAAPGPSLHGKNVLVVARARPGGVDGEKDPKLVDGLAGAFASALREAVNKDERLRKIRLVDDRKVGAWLEAHPSATDGAEVGRAFDADVVIVLDVQTFRTGDPKTPDLMEGTSNIQIRVQSYDHPKNARGKAVKREPREWVEVYDDQASTVFPARGVVPRGAGVSESAFNKKFLKVVAQDLSRHFVDHPSTDDARGETSRNQ